MDRPETPSATSRHPPVPPSLGAFAITGVLGEGGSGTVYAASMGATDVALKVMRADVALSEKEERRFVEEAARMRRVEHPSLVKLLDVGTLPDGRPYLAMPRLRGETLASRLERGPFSLSHAVVLFEQLCGAVRALHAAGLIHRDIKPENIFVLAGDERLVLLDFGIAREIDAPASTTTQAGKVRGTPAYMAPERFFGKAASIGTDVYELAVVLYMMLVGRLPWPIAQDAAGRLSPMHPAEIGVNLPASIVTTLMSALSMRPDARPASVAAFVDEVKRRAEKEGAPLPSPSRRGVSQDSGPAVPLVVEGGNGTPEAWAAMANEPTVPLTAFGAMPTVLSEASRTTSPTARTEDVQSRRSPVAWLVAAVAALGIAVGGFVAVRARGQDSVAMIDVASATPRIAPPLATSSTPPAPMETSSTASIERAIVPDPDEAPRRPDDTTSARPVPSSSAPRPLATTSASVVSSASSTASAPSPTLAASSTSPVGKDLPWCRKLVGLYCSPAWLASEIWARGSLCSAWQGNLAKWSTQPDNAKEALEGGCQSSYGAGLVVLRGRQAALDAGVRPPAPSP